MDNNLLQNSVNATFSQSQKFHKAVKAAAEKKEILNTVIRASRTRKQRKRNTARRLYYQTEEGKAQNDSRLNPEAPVFRPRPSFSNRLWKFSNFMWTWRRQDPVSERLFMERKKSEKLTTPNQCCWFYIAIYFSKFVICKS